MTGTSDNPLLDLSFRIPFHRIEPSHVAPAVRSLLAVANEEIEELADPSRDATWDSSVARFERVTSRVRRATVPVQHLLAVAESPELREAWNKVLPEVSRFWTRLYLHRGMWEALERFARTAEAEELDALRKRHLDRTLRDFRRAGADLPLAGRERLEAIDIELSKLEQRFSENVLDATAAFALRIEDPARLAGIPEDALERFRSLAQEKGLDGWVLTLDHPSYLAVTKHAKDRSLRQELHAAYLARGAQDPWDNRPLIPAILHLRREKARLLGYGEFPDFRLEEQMVRDGARARRFLESLVERTSPYWERDLGELRAHAAELGLDRLRPWDVAYVMESLRKKRFDFDEEELRPYFPLEAVLGGLFGIVRRLFGLEVEERSVDELWHEDVRYYEVRDGSGELLAGFYADLFPRREKRQGAWMNDFIYGEPRPDGRLGPHLGTICANFPPPGRGRPALLEHRDVETLFHEFGHLLHHSTSRVPIESRGGINVAWDWVELPSQLLENWAWEREALAEFARHWETGDPLPDALYDKMQSSRRFMGGWLQMRQLSFGVMDLALHTDFSEGSGDVMEWAAARILPLTAGPEFARANPLPSFLHLFPGGYAASYYAYLWAEVLEADLFSRFQREGIFNRETGLAYLETVLSQGDRKDPEELFRDFMGRDPDPEALIRRNLAPAAPEEDRSARRTAGAP